MSRKKQQVMVIVTRGDDVDTNVVDKEKIGDLRVIMNEAISKGYSISIIPVDDKPSKKKKQ